MQGMPEQCRATMQTMPQNCLNMMEQMMEDRMRQGGMGGEPSNRRMGGDMMMNHGMMGGRGMMGGGMMGSGMGGRGQTGAGMMGGTQSGMGALFGSRVALVMNLSADDVRGYLDGQVKRLGNKREPVSETSDRRRRRAGALGRSRASRRSFRPVPVASTPIDIYPTRCGIPCRSTKE